MNSSEEKGSASTLRSSAVTLSLDVVPLSFVTKLITTAEALTASMLIDWNVDGIAKRVPPLLRGIRTKAPTGLDVVQAWTYQAEVEVPVASG